MVFSTTRGTLATPKLFAALALLSLAALPNTARAQTAAIDFTSFTNSTVGVNSVRGWEFNVTSPLTVTALSFFDNLSDGLVDAHDVGLWNSAGTLLASVTVPSGTTAPLDSSGIFRYVNLGSSLALPIGTGYRVGGTFIADTSDIPFFQQVGMTTAPGVTYVQGVFNSPTDSLAFPTNTLASGLGGGSFVVGAASAPEPGTLALLALGMVGGIVARRRK